MGSSLTSGTCVFAPVAARTGKLLCARALAGYIAQWLERLTADQQVPGSNPGVSFVCGNRSRSRSQCLTRVDAVPAALAGQRGRVVPLKQNKWNQTQYQ